MGGAFSYKNTERRSFELKQGDDTIEVFYELLPVQKQALILRQNNFSGALLRVTGSVKRFSDAQNSYYITATDVVMLSPQPAATASGSAGLVSYTGILLAPERYIGRQITTKGALSYKNTERKSFDLKQGDDTIEVFYELLPPQQQALILRQRNFSDVPVTVRGTVQRFRNAENSYYIMAAEIVILQTRPAAGVARRPVQREGRDSDVTFSPAPAQPKRSLPTAPIVREPTRPRVDRRTEPEDSRKIDSRTLATVCSLVGLVVLLTIFWVAFDARANKITFSKGPYSLRNGALAWAVACGVVWVAAFPYYLVRRSTALRERGRILPPAGPPPAAPSPVSGATPAGGKSSVTGRPALVLKPGRTWYYVERNKTVGPMEEAYIHVLVSGGQLDKHKTLVWQEGMDGWWFYDQAFTKEGMVTPRPLPAKVPPLPVLVAATVPSPAKAEGESADAGRPKAQPRFVKGACQHCGGHVEFSSLMGGQTIDCPHCRKRTRLEENLAQGMGHGEIGARALPVGIPVGRRTVENPSAAHRSPDLEKQAGG